MPGASLRLQRAPKWMSGYCQKAAEDLGYAVLCPRRLPTLIDIIPCKGPVPRQGKAGLWGKYCYDWVLDGLFRGPPGYRGLSGTNPRVGHWALWTIAPSSDFYPRRGLFACPDGGMRKQPGHLGGHAGYWWECPVTRAANVNSGHIAFQWSEDGLIYGLSVHRISAVNRLLVRRLFDHFDLVGPR